tara:strand:- start:20 stop:247 length:228 start_codon:yes stop_codon:yes gene_type:complete
MIGFAGKYRKQIIRKKVETGLSEEEKQVPFVKTFKKDPAAEQIRELDAQRLKHLEQKLAIVEKQVFKKEPQEGNQ